MIKTVLALVAVAAVGVAAIPADALARGGHGGGGGGMRSGGLRAGGFGMGRPAGVIRPMAAGSFVGGGMRVAGPGYRHHHHHFRRFAFVGPYTGYWDYPSTDGCYQVRRVLTSYGWRWRRVDVCN
ncbi:hypothetical protein [Bradyrhizobium prioriisuperbiae]|uniref:hypothetical protein n=1 Tax=Bradyrhizobium prioriisuperbiae TaxID=2854389 RepID=UPI0028E39219|nr:hypothetical protein [Bradyrhizobium prioritasuperba]